MIECIPCGPRAQNVLFKCKSTKDAVVGRFILRILDNRYEIWSLGIMGEYRRKGCATQMLREFLQQFKNDKPLVLYVYKTNEIAIRLYEKVGFAIVGKCDFESEAYKMQYIQSVR